MKRTTWKNFGLTTVLVTGVLMTHTLPLRAQEKDSAGAAATNNPAIDELVIEMAPAEDSTNELSAATEDDPAHLRHNPIVVFGGTALLKEGESAEAVVGIFGSAKALGKVREAVVAIGGDALAEGDVGDAVVAVGGNATAKGKVGAALVAIIGDAEAQGEVNDAVVAVMGDVTIGSNAIVHGDVVSVGGKVVVASGAQVEGKVTEVGVGDHPVLAPLKGLADWFKHCVLKLRILAPQAGWYWVIAGIFLLCYLLITVAFPRPVAACVNELTQRPATTFLLGLLTKLLVPLILLVLGMTVIGGVVVPFVLAAVFIGAMIGKVALFQYFGRQLVRPFGIQLSSPMLAMLAGFVLITLLYMVPVLSLLVYMLVGLWGLGVAVTAAFGGARRETPVRPSAPVSPVMPGPIAPANPPVATALAATVPPATAGEFSAPPVFSSGEAGPPPSAMPVPPASVAPPAAGALIYPRANFWERMGAAFLDLIVTGILAGLVGGPPLAFLVVLAYFAGMWAWKGTTIGGLVLNLKVVRLDDKPVTFVVALVRGLAAMLSVIVFFLGFLWMIWDPDKQTWHDKIAGTVVIRVPRGMSLVCL